MKISAKAKVQNETKGALTANGLLSAASSSTIDRSYCSLSGSTLLPAQVVVANPARGSDMESNDVRMAEALDVHLLILGRSRNRHKALIGFKKKNSKG